MTHSRDTDPMLAGVRVLDLCRGGDTGGLLAGQILADLGAEVIQAQPSAQRGVGRTTDGGGPATVDWHWRAYTRGKQVLDTDLDAATIAALLERADVLIEDLSHDAAARLGLAPQVVAERYPHVVHASITPFGQTGPKAHYAASDLTLAAASGFLFASGATGEPPLRISIPQAHAHAGADAAVAILIALRARAAGGRGQHIDVAAQHSFTLALLGRGLDAAVNQPRVERVSGYAMLGTVRVRTVYPARDGWVLVSPAIAPPVAAFMRRLMNWAVEDGLCDAAFVERDWGALGMQLLQGSVGRGGMGGCRCGRRRVARDAYEGAGDGRSRGAQAVDRAGACTSANCSTAHTSNSAATFSRGRAGTSVRSHVFRAVRCDSPPTSGSVDVATLQDRWQPRVHTAGNAQAAPLAGLKVLDLFWVVAGPGATRMLADYGATVVHVESRNRLDMLRGVPPYIDGVPGPERTPGFHSTNANKLNLSLDLASTEGRAVLADLIRWADVFGESFSPGVVERMGFGYDAVRALNPRIIMISSCLMGQSGPWRDYAGFGNMAGAVCGFYQLAGQPDAPPVGSFGPYTDFMGVRYNALAILGALAHRDRTGEGQFIDMAQAEAALHFVAPAVSAYLDAGIVPVARGNRDETMAPHGVYPARGVDRWVAIAVRTDAQWQQLARHAELHELAADPALATLDGRQARRAPH